MSINITKFFILMLLANLLAQPIVWNFPDKDSINNVNCYDRFSNKIEGLTCKKEIYGVPLSEKVLWSFLVINISLALSLHFSMEDN